MRTAEYTLRMVSPAFLGNAEQSAQWRTPPFKAQLHQWWRVVWAAEHVGRLDHKGMREEEGKLFGNAWLEKKFCKSQVRLRLDSWADGSLTKAQWTPLPKVAHGKAMVPADLYLGYGPVTHSRERRQPELKENAAIQSDEAVTLRLAYPDSAAAQLEQTLQLMHCYGTVGGRSRNGWGSYALEQHGDAKRAHSTLTAMKTVQRPWQEALREPWPHAIGADEVGALVWQTAPAAQWRDLMVQLADLKIGVRRLFPFRSAEGASAPEDRHWLSYPVTKHSVRAWNNLRLPNSLRFKLRPAPEDPSQCVAVVFHMPCLPPPQTRPDPTQLERIWSKVHGWLDGQHQLKRIAG